MPKRRVAPVEVRIVSIQFVVTKLRVMLVTNGLRYGGAERIVEALAEGLRGQGDEVSVVATTRDGQIGTSLRRQGIDVSVLGIRSAVDLRVPLRFLAEARRFSPDVIHSHLEVADLVVALTSPLLPRARCVTTIHNLGASRSRFKSVIWKGALRRFDQIIAVDETAQDTLPTGLACRVLHPSIVDEEGSHLSKSEAQKRLGLHSRVPVLVAVGRLHRIKGFDLLAEAVARLKPLEVQAVVLGEGAEKSRLEASGHLRLVGGRDDASALISAADIVVMPSRSEAFPQVALEAMARAVPLVATRVGALPRLIEDGHTGLLIPPEDPEALARALRRLLEDPAKMRTLGQAGQRRFARLGLTKEKMVRETREAYRQVVGL